MQLPQLEAEECLTDETLRCGRAKRRFLNAWTAVAAILLLGVLVYIMGILSVPIGILLWTVIIVFCLRGTVNFLDRLGVNRAIGTGVAYVLMFIVLGLVVLLMCSPALGVGEQFTNLAKSVPAYATQIAEWANGVYVRYSDFFQNDQIQAWLQQALEALSEGASGFARDSANGVIAFGSGVANTFMSIGFALVIAYWILMELPALGRECMRLAGPRHEETLQFLHLTFTRVMGGYIRGTLLQCALIGIGCGFCFGILGIPNYVALGAIAGLLNIIPIVGSWLGGALAAVVGIFVSPWIAIVALLLTIVVQQVVYTFVSPRIMASSVDIHPALNLMALMVGSALGGAMNGLMGSLVGMLASIPIVAVGKSVFVYYFEKRTGRQIVAEDGVFFQGMPNEGEIDPMLDATSPHPDSTSPIPVISDLTDRFSSVGGKGSTGKHGKG